MQFDDTNSPPTTLVGFTRSLLGDPATAPSTLWTDNEVKQCINNEYHFLRSIASGQSSGLRVAIAYDSTVSGTALYNNPTGWHSWISVEIDTTGKNISTDSTATPVRLEPRNYNIINEALIEGDLSDTAFYYVLGAQYGIIKAPTVTATNNVRLTYNKIEDSLSNNTDTPVFPADQHPLICYRAAVACKTMKDLPIGDLGALMAERQAHFDRWASDLHDDDYDYAVPIAGTVVRKKTFKQGWTDR